MGGGGGQSRPFGFQTNLGTLKTQPAPLNQHQYSPKVKEPLF